MPALYSFGTGFAREIVDQQHGAQEQAAKVAEEDRALENAIKLTEARVTAERRITEEQATAKRNKQVNSIFAADSAIAMLPQAEREALRSQLLEMDSESLGKVVTLGLGGNSLFKKNPDGGMTFNPLKAVSFDKKIEALVVSATERADQFRSINPNTTLMDVLDTYNPFERALILTKLPGADPAPEYSAAMKQYYEFFNPQNPLSARPPDPVEWIQQRYGNGAELEQARRIHGRIPKATQEELSRALLQLNTGTSPLPPPKEPPPSPAEVMNKPRPAPVGVEGGATLTDEEVVNRDVPVIQQLSDADLRRLQRSNNYKVFRSRDVVNEIKRRRALPEKEREDALAAAREAPLEARSIPLLEEILSTGEGIPEGKTIQDVVFQLNRKRTLASNGRDAATQGLEAAAITQGKALLEAGHSIETLMGDPSITALPEQSRERIRSALSGQ